MLGTAELGARRTTGGLTWTNSQTPATEPAPQSIAVADFNGDGIPDIAIGTDGTTNTSGTGYLSILLGNGDGTFQAAKNFAALPNNQTIAVAAFVDGGPEDVISINNSASNADNAVMLIGDGKGGGTIGTPFSLGVESVSAVATGDLNGDGKQDFVVTGVVPNSSNPALAIYLGNGNGTFGTPTLLPIDGSITSVVVGDFNGNGKADLAAVNTDGTVIVFLGDGFGDFSPGVGGSAGTSPSSMAVGDFNGDGKADLAVVNGGSDTVTILLSNGAQGAFTTAASPATGNTPSSIAVGDFNGDGIADLAVANRGANTVTALLGKGDGTFAAEASPATGIGPSSIAVGNFNGNGMADLAVANADPANMKTGTLTVLVSQLTQTATATANGIAPTGSGAHLVEASYPGDDSYAASVSGTTSLTGESAGISVMPGSLTFAFAARGHNQRSRNHHPRQLWSGLAQHHFHLRASALCADEHMWQQCCRGRRMHQYSHLRSNRRRQPNRCTDDYGQCHRFSANSRS